jgi:hypothetical protein
MLPLSHYDIGWLSANGNGRQNGGQRDEPPAAVRYQMPQVASRHYAPVTSAIAMPS